MTIKYILAVALITPFLTVSSMAQQYVGGPKSGIAPTTWQISGGGDHLCAGSRCPCAGSQSQQIPRLSRWPEDCGSALNLRGRPPGSFASILACPQHVRLAGDLGNAACPGCGLTASVWT